MEKFKRIRFQTNIFSFCCKINAGDFFFVNDMAPRNNVGYYIYFADAIEIDKTKIGGPDDKIKQN